MKWTSIVGVAALMSGGALAAFASTGDSSNASARFLSGTLVTSAGTLDSIADLEGVTATNSGSPTADTESGSLDLTALSAVTVDLPSGVDVPLGRLLQLGAVNQFAQASDAGVSRSASGAVDDSGAVSVSGSGDFPASASLDLVSLLGTPANGVLSTGSLNLGAVTGVAADDEPLGPPLATTCADLSNPSNCRDYNVASADLDLVSPLVGQLVTSIDGTLGTVDTTVDGLSSAIDNSITGTLSSAISALVGGADQLTVTVGSNLQTALAPVLTGTLTDGGVSLDLDTGAITVDLSQVLVGGLSNQPPDTALLSPAVLTTISGDLDNILQQLQTNLNTALPGALNAVPVTISGGVCEPTGCGLPLGGTLNVDFTGTVGDLLAGDPALTLSGTGLVTALLAPILNTLTPAVGAALATVVQPVVTSAISTVGTGVDNAVSTLSGALDPVLTDLGDVVGVNLNEQEAGSTAGSFREVAVRVSVLGGAVTTLDLGRAEVGPNVAVAASISSLDPTHGPQTGGTTVTITGNGFTDATGVTFDGTAGTVFTVVSDTEITVTTPAHDPGAVDVQVLSPTGDSAAATYTYDAVPAVTTIAPDSGPDTGGTPVVITGTGFTGSTGVTFDGVPATDFTVVSDTEIDATTPPHAAGAVDVVVDNPNGDSAPVGFTYTQTAEVTGVSPSSGPTAGGNTVTITGQCFSSATEVTFGGVDATSFTIDSDTQITAVVPAGAAGPVDVQVSSDCGAGALPGGYTYVAPVPSVSGLDPDNGPETGGTTVTITGTGFTDATDATFDGVDGGSFTVVSDTEITVTTPPHAPGAVDVIVDGPGGSSSAVTYTYTPVANITGVSPGDGPVTGGTTVTITGQCFTGATAVTFGGVPATSFTVDSDTQITAVAPAGAATGPVDVVVTGSAACGDATAPGGFTYDAVPPTLTSLSPDNGPQTGGTTVTITGTDFTGATGVTFDGTAGTDFTVVSDTEITVTSPVHDPGTATVVVQSPAGDSNGVDFTYTPVTEITGTDPGDGPVTGGTTVTITGQCFTGATGVSFGGVPATSFTVDSDTQITAVAPAGAATGPVDIAVTGSAACGDATDPGGFTYDAVPPTLTSLSPDNGPQTGGTTVTITGTGFTDATGVTFDGTSGTAFTVVDDTTITVTTPVHDPGTIAVIVQSPAGESNELDYTYTPVASITGVSPGDGPVAGGTVVTITGQCFTGATAVTFGGVDATSFTVDSDTQITATTPAGTAGAVDVVVTGGGTCGSATDPGGFTYVAPAPAAADAVSLTPTSGPETGGTIVTITGTGFTGATGVTFDGTAGGSFTVVSDTSITVSSPVHDPGAVDVIVESPNGDSSPLPFTFTPVATITGTSPSTGPEDGGTPVTITGSCFTGATAVTFGGVDALSFTVVSDTEIDAVTPAGAGTVDVVVTGGGTCGTATDPGGFTYEAPSTGAAPVILSLTPTTGPTAGGTTVTITGSGFTGSTGVTFDGIQAPTMSVDSDTQITVTTPPHAVGTVDVIVQGPTAPATATVALFATRTSGAQARSLAHAGLIGFATGTQDAATPASAQPASAQPASLTTAAVHPAAVIIIPAADSNPGQFTYVEASTGGSGSGGTGGGTSGGGSGGIVEALADTGAFSLLGSGVAAALGMLVAGITLLVIRRRRQA